MITKEKTHTKQSFSYDEYLKEFLKIDSKKINEKTTNPYDLGINLANKDIFELKKTLTNLNTSKK